MGVYRVRRGSISDVTAEEYLRAIELCRRVVDAHDSDEEGTVAGSFLGQLRNLLTGTRDNP
jgi:hypothetical protein